MMIMVDFDVRLFLLHVFFVLLMKYFCFCTKNIDWRLPRMKLIVSIILYWILSLSSLYIAPFCWSLWSWLIHTYTLIYMCIIYIIYIIYITYIYITYLSVYLSIYRTRRNSWKRDLNTSVNVTMPTISC